MDSFKKTVKEEFNLPQVARRIYETHIIIFDGNYFYIYESGVYRHLDDLTVKKWVHTILKDDATTHRVNEVQGNLKVYSSVNKSNLNKLPDLNLKNGMLSIDVENHDEFILHDHDPNILSTVQLAVNYNPTATCPKWIKTLDEIFEEDTEKINLLQEYFGLCLTADTHFEKCLFLVGEGSNGKSVILHVLMSILSEENYTAMPLEQFGNRHYIAGLFGKLANISIETNAKSALYDSTFKAIITGDPIEADMKFQNPFTFKPFCKLIFALNNMPRVDDKSDAFYRRLLIVRFNRQFEEHEQNKNLKHELVKDELDGIFYWCLQGLMRLKERGSFEIGDSMKAEIAEFRAENNTVLLFVSDQCMLGVNDTVSKDVLYVAYVDWCKKNGLHPLSMINLNKQLKTQFKKIKENRVSTDRFWTGIAVKKYKNDRNIQVER